MESFEVVANVRLNIHNAQLRKLVSFIALSLFSIFISLLI